MNERSTVENTYFNIFSSAILGRISNCCFFNLILLSTVWNFVDSTKYKTTTNNNNAKLQFSVTQILLSQ